MERVSLLRRVPQSESGQDRPIHVATSWPNAPGQVARGQEEKPAPTGESTRFHPSGDDAS